MRTARTCLPMHAACLLAIALFGMVQLPSGAAPPPPGASLAPMLETVLPAVVNIATRAAPQMRRTTLCWTTRFSSASSTCRRPGRASRNSRVVAPG